MATTLQERLASALSQIRNPRTGAGVYESQQLRDIATTVDGKVIAISSGKGGVGKSTVAVNLAVALAKGGARVGLMDADIYGPNIPRMMGVTGAPPVVNEKIIPLEAFDVKVMSLGMMIEPDQ